jgi:pimeloyl-ACP methyl ester carboxylesterase
MIPRTEYVLAEDGVHIAYQVFGDGGLDLVFINRTAATIGYMWEVPDFARFLRRLGTMARVIALDSRGVGLSDRHLPARATLALEQRMTDIQAVMGAARSQRASLFGTEDSGSLCALFAATYPERTDRLIMYARPHGGSRPRTTPGPGLRNGGKTTSTRPRRTTGDGIGTSRRRAGWPPRKEMTRTPSVA